MIGFVVSGAVAPELVTPVMIELADDDTAFATTVLVLAGAGSVGLIPAAVALLGDGIDVPTAPIVEGLLVAVVAPMVVAVGLRAWRPERVGRYDDYYPAVSATMVVLIIGGVTAANAGIVRSNASVLVGVGLGAVALTVVGYAVGWLVGCRASRRERVASVLSVGMRDFAITAALVAISTTPKATAATSAGLAKWFTR